jgi:MipA family protein
MNGTVNEALHRWRRLRPHAPALALGLTLAAAAGAGRAQDLGDLGAPPSPGAAGSGLHGTLGVGALSAPRYLGADEHRTRALPLVQLRWGGGWSAGLDGVGYRWRLGDGATVGVKLGLDRGRRERDAEALRGMGDIPKRPELAASGTVRLLPFVMAGAGVRLGSGEDRDGLLVDWSLRTPVPLAPGVRLMLGVSGTWANAAAMQSAFGVSAAQSAASGYGVYAPAAGWRDWGPSALLMAELGGPWMLMARVDQRRLLGPARDSPLVRSEAGTSGMLTLGWRF